MTELWEQSFYADDYSQVKIQLRAGEGLSRIAGESYITDDTGRPSYIRLHRLDGPGFIDVMMTEAVDEETTQHTVFSGFLNISPRLFGHAFQVQGFVKDQAGNVTDLSGLRFVIVASLDGKPVINVAGVGTGTSKVSTDATGQLSVVTDAGNVTISAGTSARQSVIGSAGKINIAARGGGVLRVGGKAGGKIIVKTKP